MRELVVAMTTVANVTRKLMVLSTSELRRHCSQNEGFIHREVINFSVTSSVMWSDVLINL
uniref:Uncharacterized protein n=1 Tax=Octopus bimaculoides TaxID=37653 RepID=A0A0L8G5P6_OCTBM